MAPLAPSLHILQNAVASKLHAQRAAAGERDGKRSAPELAAVQGGPEGDGPGEQAVSHLVGKDCVLGD